MKASELITKAMYEPIEAQDPATGNWIRVAGGGSTTTDDRTGKITKMVLAVKMPDVPCDCPHDCGDVYTSGSHLPADGAIVLTEDADLNIRPATN